MPIFVFMTAISSLMLFLVAPSEEAYQAAERLKDRCEQLGGIAVTDDLLPPWDRSRPLYSDCRLPNSNGDLNVR